MHTIIKHQCYSPFVPNSSTFDVIQIKYNLPYKFVTINGKTKKYLI